MLYGLANTLIPYAHWLRVFHYLTFRAILACLTALIIALIMGPRLINRLARMQIGQPIRDDGPQTHLAKQGTPTMGGTLILLAVTISMLLWANLANRQLWVVLLVTLGFGLVGWIDDYRKQVLKNSRGLAARWKLFWQLAIAFTAACYLYFTASVPGETQLVIPYVKSLFIPLGVGFIFLATLVMVGSSNAVNLTDGLDGLAILPTVMVAGALGVFAYVTGNAQFAQYLGLPFVPGVGEVTVFCAALIGAGLGFLWFNAYPAELFMGDVGSLSLGAALGCIAVLVRQELILVIMGGLFVAETLSVILQVVSYRYRKKRIFKMAPLHHHFELAGWPEPKVIVRFWVVTVILVLIGLASLKLR